MKQLNLFSQMSESDLLEVSPANEDTPTVRPERAKGRPGAERSEKKIQSHWVVFIDGASRNNPGPAGAGIYIIKDGEAALERGYYLGKKTNNQAEYLAAVCGLYHIKEAMQSGETVRLVSDSELVVKQLRGIYKIRHPELKPLHALACEMVKQCNAHVEHVLRADNVEADRMANQGINNKTAVPESIVAFLQNHGIKI